MQNKGKQLHQRAADEREKGNLTDSLYLIDDALLAYDEIDDSAGFAEGLGCRSITLRLLAEQKNYSRRILTLAKHEIMAAVEIAQASGQEEALAIPLFELGKVYQYLEDYESAAKTFREALNSLQEHVPASFDKPSVLADFKIHEAIMRYANGDETGLADAEVALQQLEQSDDGNKFEKDVWISGGHMHIAEMLREKNPVRAKEHLQKAQDIINANAELIIRKQQLEKLEKEFE